MFAALKKGKTGANDDSKLAALTGVLTIGQALQRKFVRGIQYNGKLFQQLQAMFFLAAIWIVQFIGPIMDELCILIKILKQFPRNYN